MNPQQTIDLISVKFQKSLVGRISSISTLVNQIRVHANCKRTTQELFRQVHNLVGSSGTFGYDDLYNKSILLEEHLRNSMENKYIQQAQLDRIWSYFVSLRNAVNTINNDLDQESFAPKKPVVFCSKELQIPPANILIISDDEFFSYGLKATLIADEHNAVTVRNQEEVISELKSKEYDYIFSEVVLEKCTGIDIARYVRSHYSERYIPIIFITSLKHDTDFVNCILAGGDVVFIKPVNIELIRSQLVALHRRKSFEHSIENSTN